jgi:hypothetical protein
MLPKRDSRNQCEPSCSLPRHYTVQVNQLCRLTPPAPKDPIHLARIFHELLSRDHEDGRATGQPQGVGSEAYLDGTSQGPTPEDARKDGHIRSRSK